MVRSLIPFANCLLAQSLGLQGRGGASPGLDSPPSPENLGQASLGIRRLSVALGLWSSLL